MRPLPSWLQGHLFSALRQTRLVPAEASWQVGGTGSRAWWECAQACHRRQQQLATNRILVWPLPAPQPVHMHAPRASTG